MSDLRALTPLVLTVLFACGGREDAAPEPDPSPDPGEEAEAAETPADSLEMLGARIEEKVGKPTASDVESCRALPFGAKPCGGPWSYLIFSTEVTDSTAVAALVDEYNDLEDRLNREEGRVSDCRFVERPSLILEDGQCVAGERGR